MITQRKDGEKMAKIMKISALSSALLTLLFIILYTNTQSSLLLILAITAGTTAYHFIMRLLVGYIFDFLLHNRVDYNAPWFRPKTFEMRLYKSIGVKKWKGKMGTYDPKSFDPKLHSWEEIASATCQAELVHEVIIALSFLPLLAAIPFGTFPAFAVTSVLAACFDAIFVIMQRYNRPRTIKLISANQKLQDKTT